jgi:hypothetical protein
LARVSKTGNKLVSILGLLCAVLLALGWLGSWVWFGFLTWPLIYLCAAIGFGDAVGRRAIWPALVVMLVAGALLLGAILLTGQSEGEPRLVLGAPLATAFLIYGIWPLGMFLGVLYFKVFDRCVLPRRKLDAFLAEFGERKSDRSSG